MQQKRSNLIKGITQIIDSIPVGTILFQMLSEWYYRIRHLLFDYLFGVFYKYSPNKVGKKRPVVLIPGLIENSYSFRGIRKKLIAEGYPVYIPAFGLQLGNLNSKSKLLEQYLIEQQITNCYLVCHSMGGIITCNMNSDLIQERVFEIITLATPYRGSWFALCVPFIPAIRQLIPGSAILKKIQSKTDLLQKTIRISCIHDGLVVPTSYSRLNTEDIVAPVIGHLNIFKNKTGITMLTKILDYLEKL